MLAASFVVAAAMQAVAAEQTPVIYDLVIVNGRVIDPASGLDGVRSIGVNGSTIQVVSDQPLTGRTRIDAAGLVVAPGFIDLHQHGQRRVAPAVDRLKVMDGVTTAFELEVGTDDVDAWYAARAGRSILNYGVSIGHIPSRMVVMKDPGPFLPSGPAARRAATDTEIADITARIVRGLERGALAVGFGFAYTPGAERGELLEAFKAAAGAGASAHVHIRGGSAVAAANEVISIADEAGAALHIVHVQSSGGADTAKVLDIIDASRNRGVDVTTEMYPYIAGQTRIESALFDNWERYSDARFQTFLWPATGERLTRESFARYRKTGGSIILFTNTEEVVRAAAKHPLTMIASDGGGMTHPRTAGTYSRILGPYARDGNVLPLAEAVKKMTIMPAQRLEKRAPMMAHKGRLQPGADADIVVFDAQRIADRATFEKPALSSAGMVHVFVQGVPVVRDGQLVENVTPGKAVRAPVR